MLISPNLKEFTFRCKDDHVLLMFEHLYYLSMNEVTVSLFMQ